MRGTRRERLTSGIEWLNDETLLLIFRDAPAALLGLSLIAKVGFDPAEGDDPLMERSAHSIPISLLPQAPPDPALSKAGEELLSAEKPAEEGSTGIRKRGRGNFSDIGGRFDLPALASDTVEDFGLLPGVDPNARIAVRYATEADSQLRREAKQSEWYQRHGRQAGKERANAPRGFERERERERDDILSWSGRGAGEGKDFARRIGRERAQPYARPPREHDRRGGRGGRRTADDLDQELERMAQRRSGADGETMDVDMDVDMDRRERGERRPRGGGQRRERRGREDLDKGDYGHDLAPRTLMVRAGRHVRVKSSSSVMRRSSEVRVQSSSSAYAWRPLCHPCRSTAGARPEVSAEYVSLA